MRSEDCLQQIIPGIADTGVLVEVGVLRATNLLALAASFPAMRLIGIDSYETYTDPLHGGYVVTAEMSRMNEDIAKRRISKSNFADRIELRVERSDLAASKMLDASVDLVYLDKGFTAAEQFDDVTKWFPKVRPGGILAGHEAYTPEVVRATKEALKALGVIPELKIISGQVWYFRKQ
jgi:hypothetical protein